jgi:tight adherence protein B
MITNVDLGQASGYIVFALIFAAYFLALEAIFLAFARRNSSRGAVTKRLSVPEQIGARPPTDLVKLRQWRSLSPDGDYVMPSVWLNQLVAQSGFKLGRAGLPAIVVGLAIGTAVLLFLVTGSLVASALMGLAFGVVSPLLALLFARARRRAKFEAELPEAMDTIVRSLRAGHPVQAAIRMVVRDMPDPVGTEFGMVADELTYGSDLETAMKSLHRRVGQQDLGLLVAAVGLQGKTGGNLAEILSNLSAVIRDRLRMRLKVRALSAEARFSAIVLSILPIALFVILSVIAPGYYGAIWEHAITKPLLVAAAMWMALGNVVMYRMVRFEI